MPVNFLVQAAFILTHSEAAVNTFLQVQRIIPAIFGTGLTLKT